MKENFPDEHNTLDEYNNITVPSKTKTPSFIKLAKAVDAFMYCKYPFNRIHYVKQQASIHYIMAGLYT